MSRGSQVLAALFTILLTLLVGEVIVRLTLTPPGYVPINHREDSLYTPHLNLGYALRPRAHHQYVTPELSVAIDISSDGLRDTTLAAAKQAQYRVLAVGNSFTMGLAVAVESTWSKQLERLLVQRNPRRSVHVVNGGVAGFSPRQVRDREDELLPLVQPQAVVYELTTQSFALMYHPNVWFGTTLAPADKARGLLITKHGLLYTPFHNKWIRKLDYWTNRRFQLGAHVLHWLGVMLGKIPRAPYDELQETDTTKIRDLMKPTLDELAAAQDLAVHAKTPLIVLLANPQLPDGSFSPLESDYNRIVGEYCRGHGIRYIDLLPTLIRQAGGRPIFRTPHDEHWTPAAHALAAHALVDSLPAPRAARP
jgi:hypothetical protein